MSVELLTQAQLENVAKIELECFSEPWSVSSLGLLTQAPNVGFVAMADGRAVAYGGMMCVLDEGQITNIATLGAFRGRGYADAVLSALCEYAEQNGICEISLEVRRSNEAALSLYEKHGFLCVGERRGFYRKPTEDAIIMKKTIANCKMHRPQKSQ